MLDYKLQGDKRRIDPSSLNEGSPSPLASSLIGTRSLTTKSTTKKEMDLLLSTTEYTVSIPMWSRDKPRKFIPPNMIKEYLFP